MKNPIGRICGVALLSLSLCEASEEPPHPSIEGVKAEYALPQPVSFTIINPTPRSMIYEVGVLVEENGKWQEFLTNLEDHEEGRMEAMTRQLPGNKSQKLTWVAGKLPKKLLKAGTYRIYVGFNFGQGDAKQFAAELSVNIGSEVGKPTHQLFFSEAFQVK